ncbi:MAG: hypothetical protein ABI859_11280, partial [Pseudomonadota bacterium]
AGQRRPRLAVFFWSTIPGWESFAGPASTLLLRVNDRQLRLDPLGKTPRVVGCASRRIRPFQDGVWFESWRAGRGAFAEVVAHTMDAR